MTIFKLFAFITLLFCVSCKKGEVDTISGGDIKGIWALQKEYQTSTKISTGQLYWDTTMYFDKSTWELYRFHNDSTFGFFDSGGPKFQDTGTYRTVGQTLQMKSLTQGDWFPFEYQVRGDILELKIVDTFHGYRDTYIKTLKKL